MINKKFPAVIFIGIMLFSSSVFAQINESKTGAWYMYFFNTTFKESSFGLQGDGQYRNWNLLGDLEQLLLRGGVTYSPVPEIKLTAGYAHITSGAFGDSNDTSNESRTYQEALLPQKIGNRFYLTHRFRYEQRWVENQDFRTRYRYNLFLNVPLNQANLNQNSIYLALYNELFINGERKTGNGNTVEIFDRNRLYSGFGYSYTNSLRFQLGYMEQTSDLFSKGQLQVSVHHVF